MASVGWAGGLCRRPLPLVVGLAAIVRCGSKLVQCFKTAYCRENRCHLFQWSGSSFQYLPEDNRDSRVLQRNNRRREAL